MERELSGMCSSGISSLTWQQFLKQGMLGYDGNVIVAKSVPAADSVVIDQLRFHLQQNTLFYSFKLIGDLNTTSCSVFRLQNVLQSQVADSASTSVPLLNLYCRSGSRLN